MQIICPYCCEKFDASNMVFRLEKSLLQTEKTDDGAGTARPLFGTGSSGGDSDDGYQDEKLIHYFQTIEFDDEETARRRAKDITKGIETTSINPAAMTADMTDYNTDNLLKYGFVTELTYKGQRLKKRLCPICHNEVVPMAGFYEMKLIAMYGGTNSGKTVYLTALETALRHDPRAGSMPVSFEEMLEYQGSDEDREKHAIAYERLVKPPHVLYAATPGKTRVKPQTFLYSYRTKDQHFTDESRKQILLVFCDIAGEDLRRQEQIRKTGFYLNKADGLIVLLDAMEFPKVEAELHMGNQLSGMEGSPEQIIQNLKSIMVSAYGAGKIPIPTAVVLTKVDELQDRQWMDREPANIVNAILGKPIEGQDRYDDEPNNDNRDFFDRRHAVDFHGKTEHLLTYLGGNELRNVVANTFANYCLFAISSLGSNPRTLDTKEWEDIRKSLAGEDNEKRESEDQGDAAKEQQVGRVVDYYHPIRVTEPFYWLLAKASVLPYHYEEVWHPKKGDKPLKISFYYYEKERETVHRRLNDIREHRLGPVGRARDKKWPRVTTDDSL